MAWRTFAQEIQRLWKSLASACAKIRGRWADFVVRATSATHASMGGSVSPDWMKPDAARCLVQWWLQPSS